MGDVRVDDRGPVAIVQVGARQGQLRQLVHLHQNEAGRPGLQSRGASGC
jgi:hypothetical protein